LIAHPYLIARNSEGSPRVGSDGRVSGANTTGLTGSHTHGDGHNHGTGLTGNHTTGEHNHNHSTTGETAKAGGIAAAVKKIL
jgi:hypothetical protein